MGCGSLRAHTHPLHKPPFGNRKNKQEPHKRIVYIKGMSASDAQCENMIEDKDEKVELMEEGKEEPKKTDEEHSMDGRRKPRNRQQMFDLNDIIKGKREKKTVQRLDFQVAKPKERLKIENGKGDKLGDIARANHQIGRMKPPDLKPLHKILFDRPGAVSNMRKNMRLFNGFLFDVDSDLYAKKQKMLLKLTNTKLRTICKVLDLERGGTQSVLADRILTFLMAPKITGKLVILKKKKKSKKNISSKDSTGKTKAKPKSASPRKSKAESKSKAIVTDSSSEDEDEDEEEDKPGVTAELDESETEKKGGKAAKKEEQMSSEDTDDSDDDMDVEEEEKASKSKPAAKGKATSKKTTPVKKRPVKVTAPPKNKSQEVVSDSESMSQSDNEKDSDSEIERARKTKKKPPAKKAPAAKPAAKTKKADSSSNRLKITTDKDAVVDDNSDDDEPLIKMIKKPPSDEQLKEMLKSILKDANLEEMTMKHICQKVYDTYPAYDLTGRKDFIKKTVKLLIS
ncbi:protein DEK [Hypomesus transpacificus]|uniref:protein DEK n=1 Tax=Hypomesus transpacificus TaxID=137520 RepID=UPI001F07E4F9|nr:protein DEK [Hypomesus transpacificus]